MSRNKVIKFGGCLIFALIGAFLAIQLIPVWLLQRNPPVVAEPQWDSVQTRELAQRACFDCHSNETVWPAYSRVAPISWLVTLDTLRGRRALNFSEWGQPRASEGFFTESGEAGERGERSGGEAAETVSEGSMPPAIYLLTQPQARLTDAEKQQLITGLRASLQP